MSHGPFATAAGHRLNAGVAPLRSPETGETRHESYGRGQFKVHDLENLGDKEMVFMTIEFLQSANKPMPLPETVRQQAAA